MIEGFKSAAFVSDKAVVHNPFRVNLGLLSSVVGFTINKATSKVEPKHSVLIGVNRDFSREPFHVTSYSSGITTVSTFFISADFLEGKALSKLITSLSR